MGTSGAGAGSEQRQNHIDVSSSYFGRLDHSLGLSLSPKSFHARGLSADNTFMISDALHWLCDVLRPRDQGRSSS